MQCINEQKKRELLKQINDTLKIYKNKTYSLYLSRLIRYRTIFNSKSCVNTKVAFLALVTINDIKSMYSKVLNQANKFGLKDEFDNFVKSTIKNKMVGNYVNENANNLNEHLGFGKSSASTSSSKSSASTSSSKSLKKVKIPYKTQRTLKSSYATKRRTSLPATKMMASTRKYIKSI